MTLTQFSALRLRENLPAARYMNSVPSRGKSATTVPAVSKTHLQGGRAPSQPANPARSGSVSGSSEIQRAQTVAKRDGATAM